MSFLGGSLTLPPDKISPVFWKEGRGFFVFPFSRVWKSAHEILQASFCAHCGEREVKKEGDVCDTCEYLLSHNSTMAIDTPKPLPRPVISHGQPCKGGCGEFVMTHKGLAGWCGSDKNGCRDKEIIRRFENGEWQNGQFPVNAFIRVFGADKAMEEKRKFLGVDMTKDEQLKSPPVVKSPPRITDPDGLLDRKLPAWLADVKEQITGALECVGQAERDLEVAKADLKASLEKALTRLG